MNTENIRSFDEITESFFESYVPAENTEVNENADELDFAMSAINSIAAEKNIIIESNAGTEKHSTLRFVILLIFIFFFIAALVFIALLYFRVDLTEFFGRFTSLVTAYANNAGI